MSNENRHIIEKVAIEIDVNSMDQAHEIESDIQSFVKQKIIPEIERYFEAINRPDLHMQLDRISLNFDKDILTNPFWQTDLQKQLQKEFEEPIALLRQHENQDDSLRISSNVLTRNDIEIRNVETSELSALSHFLSTGNSPWWMHTSPKEMGQILEEENMKRLLERNDVILLLKQLFSHQPVTKKRWVLQFSSTLQLSLYWKLTSSVYPPSKSAKTVLHSFVKSSFFKGLPQQNQQKIWFAVLTAATRVSALQSDSGKAEIVMHLVKPYLINTSGITHKKLKDYIIQIIQKKDVTIDYGNLPPILFFALSMVTDLLEKDQIIALKNLEEIRNSEFKITVINSIDFEWVASGTNQSIRVVGNTSDQKRFLEEKERENSEKNVKSDPSVSNAETGNTPKTEDKNVKNASVNSTENAEVPKSDLDKAIEEDWEPPKQVEKAKEGVYIENAGILLMHPFFVPLFKNLGYLDENKQLTQPLKAVQLLHFMATGELECFEYEMQFAKFLCGISGDEVLDKSMMISDQEREEVEKVLLSALEYWKSLKSNSISLLQHEFLKRSGKLFSEGDTKRVVVEQKTVDILMNDLPWGIGMLRLPWMRDLIYVNWN